MYTKDVNNNYILIEDSTTDTLDISYDRSVSNARPLQNRASTYNMNNAATIRHISTPVEGILSSADRLLIVTTLVHSISVNVNSPSFIHNTNGDNGNSNSNVP